MKKYELITEDTIGVANSTLYRIRALKDFADVKAGDLGGYVEAERNLSHAGDCWLYGRAKVYENAIVWGDAKVEDFACVCGNARVFGDAYIYDDARIYGNARVYGGAQVYGDAALFGDCTVSEQAHVYGEACVSGRASVGYTARVSGNDAIIWFASVSDELNILTVYCGRDEMLCSMNGLSASLLMLSYNHRGRIYELLEEAARLKLADAQSKISGK